MKLRLPLFLLLFSSMSLQVESQTPAETKMNQFVNDLMKQMTLEEKIGQLNLPGAGDIVTGQASSSDIGQKIRQGKVGGLFNIRGLDKIRSAQDIAVKESRLKIPLIFGMDVIHGYETIFPIPLGLAATWDPQLIEQSARIAAVEATAQGICWNFSPMADLSRDPRWGRVAEGIGEDPYLGSLVTRAMVRGYQGRDLSMNNTMMATVKHFALYGASEAGRDYNTVDMSHIRMFNEYFPPYKAAIDEGVGCVMTSFNEIDGIPATGNRWLLTDILRRIWKFKGFVVSDYTSVNEMMNHGLGDLKTVAAMSLKAGLDMDMVGEAFLTTLQESVNDRSVDPAEIDQACRRILEAKYKLGLFEDPYRYCDENRARTDVFTEGHRRIARQTAAESFVLLKNKGNILPLKKNGTIALIGPLMDNKENMSGTWSVAADLSKATSILNGLREVGGGNVRILTARGSNLDSDSLFDERAGLFGKSTGRENRSPEEMIQEAVTIAAQSDVVVAVLGESSEMSGESSSRTDIGIPKAQQDMLHALVKTGKPIVLVLLTGRPLTLTWEDANVPSILNVWFGGTEAGRAVADVLFGDVNPSGKLPSTFPRHVGQIPLHYNHKNTGRPLPEGKWFSKFTSNYLDVNNEPLYPFGHGLSYTTFSLSDPVVSTMNPKGDQILTVTATLTNTGNTTGKEVIQLYVRDKVGSVTRPVKELKRFQKIELKPGEKKNIRFDLNTDDLKFYNYDLIYDWEPGAFDIMLGTNSKDVKTITVNWSK